MQKYRFLSPDGWQSDPQDARAVIDGKSEQALSFRVRISYSARLNKRTVITAEVKTDEHDWGEFAEMLLDEEINGGAAGRKRQGTITDERGENEKI